MDIASVLKNLRCENGLTQQELSERLKIGQATIACYESGQREPHILNLIAYADYFECSLDFITGRTDDFGNVIVGIENSKHSETTLTKEEREILNKYRKLSGNTKIKLNGYLDGLLDKT